MIPQRCKSIPGVFRHAPKDPKELGAFLRMFLNDKPGGFASGDYRLPQRFFMAPLALLSPDELAMIARRLTSFVVHWLSIARDPKITRGSPVSYLFLRPIDGTMMLAFATNPPAGFVPSSKYYPIIL